MSHLTLKNSLISWWDLTEDPTTGIMPDRMKRHSMVTSGVTQVDGPVRDAARFTTGSRMVAKRSGSNSAMNRDYTVSFWFKMYALTPDSSNVLFGRQPTNGALGEFRISWSALRNLTLFNSAGSQASSFPLFLPLNVWHFMAVAKRGAHAYYKINNYSIFKTLASPAVTSTNNYDLCIGCDPANLVAVDAAMQRVGLWFRGLTDDELLALWNDGDGLFFDDLKSANCKETTCCPTDDFVYKANQGTDADGDVDRGGPSNPGCPEGYIWGGLSCLREQTPQVCSQGYFWNGVKCVTNEECANGWFFNDYIQECEKCEPVAAPSLAVVPGVQVTATFPVGNVLVWRSEDGVNYTAVQFSSSDVYDDTNVVIGRTYWYFGSTYDADCEQLIDGPPEAITFF